MSKIMQGDAYTIPITIKSADGTTVDPAAVQSVEIVIGTLNKKYPDEISYSDGKWLFPLTQEESMRFVWRTQTAQVRVKFTSGEVVGAKCGCIGIEHSQSKEVL